MPLVGEAQFYALQKISGIGAMVAGVITMIIALQEGGIGAMRMIQQPLSTMLNNRVLRTI
jgi:hypothetical protein